MYKWDIIIAYQIYQMIFLDIAITFMNENLQLNGKTIPANTKTLQINLVVKNGSRDDIFWRRCQNVYQESSTGLP